MFHAADNLARGLDPLSTVILPLGESGEPEIRLIMCKGEDRYGLSAAWIDGKLRGYILKPGDECFLHHVLPSARIVSGYGTVEISDADLIFLILLVDELTMPEKG